MTCQNTISPGDWLKPSQHPCKVSFFDKNKDSNSDYVDLVNSVERHTRCTTALKQTKTVTRPVDLNFRWK